jgi:hypothetical protein
MPIIDFYWRHKIEDRRMMRAFLNAAGYAVNILMLITMASCASRAPVRPNLAQEEWLVDIETPVPELISNKAFSDAPSPEFRRIERRMTQNTASRTASGGWSIPFQTTSDTSKFTNDIWTKDKYASGMLVVERQIRNETEQVVVDSGGKSVHALGGLVEIGYKGRFDGQSLRDSSRDVSGHSGSKAINFRNVVGELFPMKIDNSIEFTYDLIAQRGRTVTITRKFIVIDRIRADLPDRLSKNLGDLFLVDAVSNFSYRGTRESQVISTSLSTASESATLYVYSSALSAPIWECSRSRIQVDSRRALASARSTSDSKEFILDTKIFLANDNQVIVDFDFIQRILIPASRSLASKLVESCGFE